MKKKIKKSLSLLLAVVLLLTAAPLAGVADLDLSCVADWFSTTAKAATEGYLNYEVENGEATITGYNTSISGEFVIPSTLGGYPVTSIGSYAFRDCTGLTSITIPDSVTSIDCGTFYGCTGLTSITIGNSVTSIGYLAFYNCTGLTSVTIGNSVTSIGYSAFSGCTGLTSVTIPDSVTSIVGSAFYGCTGLTSLTIPDSVTSIGWYAFSGCTGLTSVTIGTGVTSIEESVFSDCTGLTKINWNAENVSDFDRYEGHIFSNAGTAGEGIDVVFGDNVKSIPAYAFYCASNIKSVTIGNSVTSIGDSAFYSCTGLTKINWNAESVDDFGEYNDAFSNAGTTGEGIDIVFGDNVKSIPAYLLYNPSSDYKTPKIKSVTIGDNVEHIGASAFDGTAWYVAQPFGDVYAGKVYYKYKGTMLENTSVEIKNGTKGIADEAFSDCSGLVDVTIPNSVTTIGNYAFYNCSSLSNIEIPNSVARIGAMAFRFCYNLNNIDIPNSVTSIGNSAFSYCHGLTNVTIPDSVTAIGQEAFSACNSLTTATIGSGIETISSGTFKNCPNLTTIKIKKGVKSIEKDAFNGIKSIPDVFFEGSEEEWKKISIDQSNDMILRANMHYNADLSHEHSYTETVKEATCTEDGLKTFTCSCGRTYSEKIPAIGHNYHPVIVEPTCVSIGYETSTCENCGESYFIRPIPAMGHRDWDGDGFCDVCSRKMSEVEKPDTKETADEKTGVTVEYPNGTFSGNVKLNAETVTEGKIFEIVSGEKGNFKRTVYSITTSVNGREAQPNGTVSVKIPLPEGYDGEKTNVYYVSEEGTLEKLECRTENGYVIFETDHFSYYAVVDESENGVTPENCSCACHKKGIAKFFFKIGLIFQKIFKKNKICKCGVWHY